MCPMSDEKDKNTDKDDDRDLSIEKEVAPEENSPWLPEPEPTEGGAPLP